MKPAAPSEGLWLCCSRWASACKHDAPSRKRWVARLIWQSAVMWEGPVVHACRYEICSFPLNLQRLCKTGLVKNEWLCACIMMYFLKKRKKKETWLHQHRRATEASVFWLPASLSPQGQGTWFKEKTGQGWGGSKMLISSRSLCDTQSISDAAGWVLLWQSNWNCTKRLSGFSKSVHKSSPPFFFLPQQEDHL